MVSRGYLYRPKSTIVAGSKADSAEAVEGAVSHAGPSHIEVVRVVDRTEHVSPRARRRYLEYHIRNPTQIDFVVLYLPLPKFASDLRIVDEDGRRLNYYANHEVKAILAELATDDPDAHARLEHRFKHARYKLLLFFPPDAPLKRASMRTITLEFENDDPVAFERWTPFSVPVFRAEDTRYPGHPHEHFFIVVGLPEQSVSWKIVTDGPVDRTKIYENGTSGASRLVSVRFPPAEGAPYTWRLEYSLVPGQRWSVRILASFLFMATLLGITLILLPFVISAAGGEFTAAGRQVGLAVSGGLAATAAATVFTLTHDWSERYKLWLAAPFALNVAAWLVWSLAEISG